MVRDNPDLLLAMVKAMEQQDSSLCCPGPYWQEYANRIIHAVRLSGLAGFRSNPDIGKGFCDVFTDDPRPYLHGMKRRCYELFAPYGGEIFFRQYMRWKNRVRHARKNRYYHANLNEWMTDFTTRFDLPETCVGTPQRRIWLGGREYGELYLRNFAWVSDFAGSVDFSNVNAVMEIGGGFGSMAHTLLHLFPNISKYLYVDIPPVLYVSTQYLRHFFGESVQDFQQASKGGIINFRQDDSREIIAICPWQLQQVRVSCDLFWNSSSFQEMPRGIVSNYAKYLEMILSPESAMCLFFYTDVASAHTITDHAVLEEFQAETTFRFSEVQLPISRQVLSGSGYLGRRIIPGS